MKFIDNMLMRSIFDLQKVIAFLVFRGALAIMFVAELNQMVFINKVYRIHIYI